LARATSTDSTNEVAVDLPTEPPLLR